MHETCEAASDARPEKEPDSDKRTHDKPLKRKGWPKRLALTLVGVFAACAIAFGAYVSNYYHAEDTFSLLSDATTLSVEENDEEISIAPPGSLAQDSSVETGVVFYPGAKVDPHAYVPLAEKLADKGYLCIIAKMPFNLAFFDIDAALRVVERHPQATSWWIAGHSLGGVAAAECAAERTEAFEGIAFLASYPASDLSETGLQALSVYGSQDLVLNRDSFAESADNLPKDAQTLVIEGGNHAGFGAYGPQKGDGEASLSADEQQEVFVEAFDMTVCAN